MIQENVILEVERRQETGKNAANRLRAADRIPAVIYGGGRDMETLPLSIPRQALLGVLRKGLHDNAIFQLRMKGTDQQRHVMIRDLTVDPVTRAMLHVDFVRVLLDKKLRVKVPVAVVGVANGVKNEGGILNIVSHEIAVECLPTDIPEAIRIDVTEMNLHDSYRVSDLKGYDKLKVLENADRVLLHIGIAKAEEAAVATTVEAGAAPAAAAEPEVIKKGKKEEEGAEAKDAKGDKKDKK